MKRWVKGMAVTLPLVAGIGYWAVQQQGSEFGDSSDNIASTSEVERSAETTALREASTEGVIERPIARPLESDSTAVNEVSSVSDVSPLLAPLPTHLDHSDSSVLAVAAELSPVLAQWLVPREQVRKWVLAVDLLADGKLPQRHRPMVYSTSAFRVIEEKGTEDHERFVAVANNSERFTALISAVVDINPRTAGRYYQAWLPLFEEAYAELGKKGKFQARVNKAADNMLSVGAMPGRGVLQQTHVLYEFESGNLERRSPLEKALWRLGDDNRESLQAYLKELKFYL